MRFLKKSRFRRFLSFALVFILMAGSMAAYSTKENTAEAAAAVNSTKEFREKFVAECLARVGSGYESGGGYTNTASKVYDCTGLIGAAFTALGFKYGFGDRTSTNTWGYWGTDKWIEFTESLSVGEEVVLYSTDMTQYLKFYVRAKNVDLYQNPELADAGSIILKPASGSSGAHATVSLGTFDDQGSPEKNVAYVQQQLIQQYSSAVANSSYSYKHGTTLEKILATNGTMYNNSNNTYGCANVWDWRQRNSITDFKADTSGKEYSKLWQVDALNNKMGVTVNNNAWGKAPLTTANLILEFEEYGNCTFTKTDDSGHALMGATFGIYKSSTDAASGANVVKTAASDSTGKVMFSDLVCEYDGTFYYIKEISAPSGYTVSNKVYPVKIYPDQTASVNGGKISNTPWSGSVSLTKLETGTGTKLPGFTFTVYEWNGSSYAKLADLTDNGDGTYSYDGLKYSQTNKGKFRLKETATDGKHVLKEDWYQDFTLTKNGQTFAFELENERSEVDAYLCLYKQSDASAALSGVKFNVYDDADCKTLLQTITTDANGYAKSAAIPVMIGEERTVYVRELFQGGSYGGAFYLPDYTVYPVTLTDANTEENPARVGGENGVIINYLRNAYLELWKLRDDTDAPISGISFKISQTAAMDSVIQTITTDANGYAKSAPINIPAEGYTVYVQEVAKDGYVPDDTVYAVKLYSDKVAVVNDGPIYNTPTKVEISKTDLVTGAELPGATLRLWEVVQLGAMTARKAVTVTTEDGQTGTSWITTGEVTKIYAQLKAGATYVLEEIAAPDGYLIANEVEFTVNADGSITKVEMKDDYTKVEISKTSLVDGAELPGATLQILDAAGKPVTVTTMDGQAGTSWITTGEVTKIYAQLVAGATYTLREIAAPDGYVIANEVNFTVNADGTVTKVHMEDDYTKVVISKISLTDGSELPGATLQILDAAGNPVTVTTEDGQTGTSWVTTGEVTKIYAQLVAGATYTLREIAAPDGYLIANEVEFTVNADGSITKVEMKDDYTKVEISKTDLVTGKEIPGATLQLIDAVGNPVTVTTMDGQTGTSWVTTGEVTKIYAQLKAGATYTLREIAAPDGYAFAEDVTFTVNADGSITKVEMQDAPLVSLPSVGGMGTGVLAAGSILLFLFAAAVLLFARRCDAKACNPYGFSGVSRENKKERGKKRMKKNVGQKIAIIGALAVCVAFSSVPTAFADAYSTEAYAPTNQPSAADRSSIAIYDVEEGATVRAYHIIEATYNTYGLTGYRQLEAAAKVSPITKNTDAKGTVLYDNPTYENIAKLAQAIHTNAGGIKSELEPLTLTWDAAAKAYVTDQAKAGSYLVLVEHEESGYIYNPMYVSNNYTDANLSASLGTDTGNGSVTAEMDVVVKLDNVEAYAKKSQTYLTKDIVNPSTGNTKVDDERIGDTVTFDIKTITPDYADSFNTTDIKFTITDRQSAGLAVVDMANIHVYVGDVETGTELATDYYTKSVNAAANTWIVDFAPRWVRENPNTEITIRYSTVIDEDAVMAANSNPNTASLEYTTVYGETDTIEDRTRHYTYELHAVKTDADDQALANATFEMTQLSEGNANGAGTLADAAVVYTAVSDANGHLDFTGLEEGTYLLREIKAPNGYTLHDSTWTITITPTYDAATNTLAKYIVTITENYADGTKGATRSYSYTVKSQQDAEDGLSDVVEIAETQKEDIAIVSIPNTKLSKLPSVGGAGTVTLALGAVVLVGGALVLTLIAKKKDRAADNDEGSVKA